MRKTIECLTMILILSAVVSAQTDYIGIGPNLGLYKAESSDGWNDRIGVNARLRHYWAAVDFDMYYHNEKYLQDIVWARCWPLTLSALVYPMEHLYAGAGIDLYQLYLDYDQSADSSMVNLENENKNQWGRHICLGIEFPFTKTGVFALEARYIWIDYHFTPFKGSEALNTNTFSIKAAVYFKLGVSTTAHSEFNRLLNRFRY
ncbi:MAG: hypothetical protein EHM72_19805 [Calditrichaeota bacterium]|nr:MAG: hypothetical protein EHM72_19805 [Calditrichota bacterium]